MPSLYIIIILSAIFTMNFWLLTLLIAFFSWTSLVGVVRAEFLRARNFEYVRAARALGSRQRPHHVPPHAPERHGGDPHASSPSSSPAPSAASPRSTSWASACPPPTPPSASSPLQGKNRLNAPWLGFTAFFTFAIMLSLLVFIFEGVRDAFDPRKTFR